MELKPYYSPEPPSSYTRNGYGHGAWKLSVEQWNLCWLSFPPLDQYLDPSVPMEDIFKRIVSEHFGAVMAAALPESEAVFPYLRWALSQPPREFMKYCSEGPWEDLPAYGKLGEAWVTTIRLRAMNVVAVRETEAVIQRVRGNVIYPQFGKPPAR